MTSQRFMPSLQGLRGLASLSVIFGHLYAMPHLSGFMVGITDLELNIINTFGHGVELFFLISGFLIPNSLLQHRKFNQFFLDRTLRIFPLYLTLHLILFILGPFANYRYFKGIGLWSYLLSFASNLVFLPIVFNLPDAQQNAWTLRYEWAFYIASAAIFKTYQLGGRNAGILLAVVVLVVALVFFPIASYFAIGTMCGMRSDQFWRSLDQSAVLGLAMLALTYYCLEYVNVFAGLIPAYIFFTLAIDQKSATARLLSAAPLQFVGKVSYSLYLVHPFVLFPLQIAGIKLAAIGTSKLILTMSFVCVGLPANLLVAALSYELIEVRLRRLLDRPLRHWLLAREHRRSPGPAS